MNLMIDKKSMKNWLGHLASCSRIINFGRTGTMLILCTAHIILNLLNQTDYACIFQYTVLSVEWKKKYFLYFRMRWDV